MRLSHFYHHTTLHGIAVVIKTYHLKFYYSE